MGKIISHEEISSLCMELSLLLHAGVGVGVRPAPGRV